MVSFMMLLDGVVLVLKEGLQISRLVFDGTVAWFDFNRLLVYNMSSKIS